MLRYNMSYYQDEYPMKIQYIWSTVKQCYKPLAQAIEEAIFIKKSFEREKSEYDYNIAMNAKTEYTRSILPGVTRSQTNEDSEEDQKLKDLVEDFKKETKQRGKEI